MHDGGGLQGMLRTFRPKFRTGLPPQFLVYEFNQRIDAVGFLVDSGIIVRSFLLHICSPR